MLGNMLLALALSMDAMVIGVTYQIRGIEVGKLSRILIGLTGFVLTGMGVLFGMAIGSLIEPRWLQYISALVIMIMGLRVLLESSKEERAASYDYNQSMKIEPVEALLIGTALSGDSASAAVVISMTGGETCFLPFAVCVMTILFFSIGLRISFSKKNLTKVAGILLLVIGFSRLVFA